MTTQTRPLSANRLPAWRGRGALAALLLGATLLAAAPFARASADDAAAASLEQARAFTEALIGDLKATAGDETLDDAGRTAALEETLLETLSVQNLALYILGRENWESATETQREQYLALFPRYIARAFASKLRQMEEAEFEIVSAQPRRANVTVHTRVVDAQGRPRADVVWLVEQASGESRLLDVTAEGQSQLVVERETVASVARREGMDRLLELMSEPS